MKFRSLKGGACSNTKPCNVSYSDSHNERKAATQNPNTTIRADLTDSNTIWMADDVPSLYLLDKAIRQDYEQSHPRKMPSKGKTAASPIKETILLLPNDSKETDKMVDKFAEDVEKLTGWRCIRKYVHRDERYDDPDTKESRTNNHAHIVWDTYDHQKHNINRASKETMRKMQDIAVKATGMPRGIDARLTKASHLTVLQQKIQAERMRLETLEQKAQAERDKADRTHSYILRVFDALASVTVITEDETQHRKDEDTDKLIDDIASISARLTPLTTALISARREAEDAQRKLKVKTQAQSTRQLTVVCNNGKYNLLDRNGKELWGMWMDAVEGPSEGFYTYRLNWKGEDYYNAVNAETGELAFQRVRPYIGQMHDGWFVVQAGAQDGERNKGKYNWMNSRGDCLLSEWADKCEDFKDGVGLHTSNGITYAIDKKGTPLGVTKVEGWAPEVQEQQTTGTKLHL